MSQIVPAAAENTDKSFKWRVLFLAFVITGILISLKLTQVYVRVRLDPGFESFCSIDDWWNCDAVAMNKWAAFLGLPVAVWGLFGYAFLFIISLTGLRRSLRPVAHWPLGILFIFSLFCVITSLTLGSISVLYIDALCILCLGTYVINIALLLLSWLAIRSAGQKLIQTISEDFLIAVLQSPIRTVIFTGLALALSACIPAGFHTQYKDVVFEIFLGPGRVPVGLTEQGHPWIGAMHPTLVIEEFSDYKCPHCQRAHSEVRKLVRDYSGYVRLVHRHFPLDNECHPLIKTVFHPGACEMARLANCAGKQGKFWEMNDLLFYDSEKLLDKSIEQICQDMGLDAAVLEQCLTSHYCDNCVHSDIQAGMDYGVKGTPSFVIDGEVYLGVIPEEILIKSIPNFKKKNK